jgi:hypothetical protein
MPATQRGQVDSINGNGQPPYRLRYYLPDGTRKGKQPFPSKSAAWKWFGEHVEPPATGGTAPLPPLTLREFVPLYLERHATTVRPRTIAVLRERLSYPLRAYDDVPLRDLQGIGGELQGWRAKLPQGSRYAIMQALRQCLGAAVRWGYITQNPAVLAGKNPMPAPRSIRAFTARNSTASRPSFRRGTPLSPRSQRPPACAPRSGRRSNVATWIAASVW